MNADCFKGPDRIVDSAVLNRTYRAGSFEDLATSDRERGLDLLKAKDGAAAVAFCAYLRKAHSFMIRLLMEWATRFNTVAEEQLGAHAAAAVSRQVIADWRQVLAQTPEEAPEPETALLLQALAQDQPTTAQMGFENLYNGIAQALIQTESAISQTDFQSAQTHFTHYFDRARRVHDLLIQYVWVYLAVVNRRQGQSAAERVLLKTLESCSFFEPMWQIFTMLPPAQLAAVMAEHLRSHFSGENRDGAVRIVEDSDCFRLIFEPCGSGGAMRRERSRRPESGDILTGASPATWGLCGVPVYCAHCAQNEISSIKRLGYPAWVTAFNLDSNLPCGWVIYKHPDKIPDLYFTRLGLKRSAAQKG